MGALTLIGFGAGAIGGGRIAPLLLSEGSRSPYAPLFAALGALLAGALVAVTLESLALGVRSRLVRGRVAAFRRRRRRARALVAAVALGLAWVFGAVALHAPGTAQLRGDVQRSPILRSLNDLLPPSGPVLNALNRVDPAPSIAGPTTPVAPPDAAIADDPDVLRAGRSVVRVLGTACGLGVEGSGWVAAPNLVVTNAHVVAGQDDTTVTTGDGASLDAVAVYYDPGNDLALLRIDAAIPALPIAAEPRRGRPARCSAIRKTAPTRSARPASATPARCSARTPTAAARSSAQIAFLRGSRAQRQLRRPDGRLRGRVLATVFAATTSGPTGGFAIPNDVVEAALDEASTPVDTGPCTG